MTSAGTNMKSIPFDSFWSIEKVQKVLKTEFPLGTPWALLERRLINSGVGCGAVEPYLKAFSGNDALLKALKEKKGLPNFIVICSTAPSGSLFRNYHGINFQVELDEKKDLLQIFASPYYRHS